jgi:hypothetical protein
MGSFKINVLLLFFDPLWTDGRRNSLNSYTLSTERITLVDNTEGQAKFETSGYNTNE